MAIKWYLRSSDASWFTFWDNVSIEEELDEVINDYPLLLNAILENTSKDSVILEGGCGLGKFLFFLRGKNYKNLIALDLVKKPLQMIKEKDPSIKIKYGDVKKIPIKNNSIDMYLSMGVIEHFEEGPKESLNEARRVLKNNGILIVAVPYQNIYRSTLRKYFTIPILKLLFPSFRNKNRKFYQYYYTKKDLCIFFKDANFEILDCFYYDQFHTKNKRIGISLEFPFMKKNNGEKYELNMLGKITAYLSESISRSIFSSSIAFVLKNK